MTQLTEEKSMFDKLDQELLDFYKHLKKKNFEEDEILQIFKPLIGEDKNSRKKYVLLIVVVLILFYNAAKTQIGWWYILAISRMFLVKIKPYYNWSHLKNQECLVEKWWQNDMIKNYTPNCNLCENLKHVEILDSLDNEQLEELYMEVQKPVVLRYGRFPTVDRLWTDIFQDDHFLTSIPCSQETNMMSKEGSIGKILKKLNIFKNFFVHFQNCEYESMKYFRQIIPVPESAPKHISPVQYNWLIWSKNYTFTKFKKLELMDSENVKMVGQIDGSILYKLVPPEFCVESCRDIEVKLEKGQVLFFTNYWELQYKVLSSDSEVENVAVILEAHSIL